MICLKSISIIKTVQQQSTFLNFLSEYFGETLLCAQWMVSEFRLTDPLPDLAIGGVIDLQLGVSRSESHVIYL